MKKLVFILSVFGAVFGIVACGDAPPPPAAGPAVVVAPTPAPAPVTIGGVAVPCFGAGSPCAILNGVMVNNGNCCSGVCGAGNVCR